MRNFARINNYANKLEAWNDWRSIEQYAMENGFADLVQQYKPDEKASWRKIDSAIKKLRKAIKVRKENIMSDQTIDQQTLEFDQKCLEDQGLKMPKLTKKYIAAVFVLAREFRVSQYFLHIRAARKGSRSLYKQLRKNGYSWQSGMWKIQ